MKKEGLEKLTKPLVYIVKIKYPDPERPIVEKFSNKEERDNWYKTIGRGIEEVGGVPLEFSEEPAEETKE